MAQKIIAERGARIHFLAIADDEGNESFFYLLLRESEYIKMQEEVKLNKSINPEDFGIVLFQGSGRNKPEEIEEIIKNVLSEIKN